jgi:CheY-like chemotaxis protein
MHDLTPPKSPPANRRIPKTVLVVDDSMLIRHTVCRFLESRGCQVHSATNGAEALVILGHFMPDLIITDLAMPRMGGEELIARIRAIEAFEKTPILVLTSRRRAAELSQGLPHGTVGVVFKNIDIEQQLSEVLDTLLF